jgi:hypothetical protein
MKTGYQEILVAGFHCAFVPLRLCASPAPAFQFACYDHLPR